MAVTFCERGKSPSRARPMSVAGPPPSFAAALENLLRYRTAKLILRQGVAAVMVGYVISAPGAHQKPVATAHGQ
jgi:hypothetical protein